MGRPPKTCWIPEMDIKQPRDGGVVSMGSSLWQHMNLDVGKGGSPKEAPDPKSSHLGFLRHFCGSADRWPPPQRGRRSSHPQDSRIGFLEEKSGLGVGELRLPQQGRCSHSLGAQSPTYSSVASHPEASEYSGLGNVMAQHLTYHPGTFSSPPPCLHHCGPCPPPLPQGRKYQHPGQPVVAHGAVRQQPGEAGGRAHAGLPGGEAQGRESTLPDPAPVSPASACLPLGLCGRRLPPAWKVSSSCPFYPTVRWLSS